MTTNWFNPEVRLLNNPWEGSLTTGFVLQTLTTAALKAGERVRDLILHGLIEPDACFADVILDPTRPRGQVGIQERVMAIVLYGANAAEYIANAAAKADAHDRHGRNIGELVRNASFCLGDGDFAYGDSTSYRGAISAGSGFDEAHDELVASIILEQSMDRIHRERVRWVNTERASGRTLAWFNEDNEPGAEYAAIRHLDHLVPATNY